MADERAGRASPRRTRAGERAGRGRPSTPRAGAARKSSAPGPAAAGERLLARLHAAEATLGAIQAGEVDAVVVSGRRGQRVVTLKGGEPAYRLLVEAMSEGAATLSHAGAVLYCNRMFADLVGRPITKVVGMHVGALLEEAERPRFAAFLAAARIGTTKGEFNLRTRQERLVPVYLSLGPFGGYEGPALGLVVTDLSDQKRRQAEEAGRAEATRRLLLEGVLSAQEEERRRVARELHDETGGLLTSLLAGLRTLQHSRSMASVKTQTQRLRKITARAIDDVGRLARGLHPTVLDDHGLGVAVGRYAAEYAATHKITVHLKLDGLESSRLSPAIQIGLYRILQEALTNVARHSGARSASIRFARSGSALEVAVSDDGCGFDAGVVALDTRRHLGIQSMRERAAILGGTVRFMSKRKGTTILVQVPLAGPSLPPAVGKAV